jgi:hypothetical protein
VDRPFSIIGRALRYYWEEGLSLLVINLAWFVAQLLVVPGPPATAALFSVTNRVARGYFARFAEFWEALKSLFGAGWKWGALNLAAIFVFGYAAFFYGSGAFGTYGAVLSLVMWFLLGLWLFLQMFAFPMWLEQTDKRIGLALRNAAVMLAHHVQLALLALLLAIVATGLTIAFWLLVAMVTPAFLATLGNTVVVAQVDALRDQETEGRTP